MPAPISTIRAGSDSAVVAQARVTASISGPKWAGAEQSCTRGNHLGTVAGELRGTATDQAHVTLTSDIESMSAVALGGAVHQFQISSTLRAGQKIDHGGKH